MKYAVELGGSDPAGLALIDCTQANALLDAQRQILAGEFPRRTFETELQITVGGLRATNGTYYTGAQRKHGVAKLAELQQTETLGIVGSAHLITKTFDREDHTRDEGTYVSVEADFTRRPKVPDLRAMAYVSVQLTGPFGDRHLEALVAAAWSTLRVLVDAAPVIEAASTWSSSTSAGKAPRGRGPRVGAFTLVDAPAVTALGGATAAAARLGAFDWKPVRGSEQN